VGYLETSIIGLVLTAGTAILGRGPGSPTAHWCPPGPSCTAGEGTHNLLRVHVAVAVLAELLVSGAGH